MVLAASKLLYVQSFGVPEEPVPFMTTAAEAFSIASQYWSTGQLAAAERMFRNVLELVPNHAQAQHALGKVAAQARNLEQAIAYLRGATESEPANAGYWNDLGGAYSMAGKYAEAAAACEQALRLRPEFAEASNNLGVALL